MKQKNNITLLVIGVLTLLVAIVGAAYAYFSSSITPGSGLNLDVEAQANTAQFTASGGQFGFTVTGAEMQQANAGSLAKEATGSINVSLTSPKLAMCTFDVAFAWNSGSSYTATSGRGSQFEFGVLYEGNPYGAINNAIKPINFDTLISNGGKVLEDAKIIINEANGTSKTTNITLNFKVQMYNLNHDQSSLAGSSSKTYSGRFYVTNVDCQENKLYLNDVILASNEIYPDNVASTYVTNPLGIQFGSSSSDTNGKGVYYTNQNTENNDYTFYFRGDVENNYVQFGSSAIDAVEQFYNLKAGESCMYNGQLVSDTNFSFNEEIGDVEYILTGNTGYCYTPGGLCEFDEPIMLGNKLYKYAMGSTVDHVCERYGGTMIDAVPQIVTNSLWRIVRINEDDSIRLILDGNIGQGFYDETLSSASYDGSTIQTNVDSWYNSTLGNYSGYLADSGYCNDLSVRDSYECGDEMCYTYNGAYRNNSESQPQFVCERSTDLYTMNASNGNKKLNTLAGILTADEALYAGSYIGKTNGNFWTITPVQYGGGYHIVHYFGVNSLGTIPVGDVSYGEASEQFKFNIRPVINLKSDIKIVSGTGTVSDPYRIIMNEN